MLSFDDKKTIIGPTTNTMVVDDVGEEAGKIDTAVLQGRMLSTSFKS